MRRKLACLYSCAEVAKHSERDVKSSGFVARVLLNLFVHQMQEEHEYVEQEQEQEQED